MSQQQQPALATARRKAAPVKAGVPAAAGRATISVAGKGNSAIAIAQPRAAVPRAAAAASQQQPLEPAFDPNLPEELRTAILHACKSLRFLSNDPKLADAIFQMMSSYARITAEYMNMCIAAATTLQLKVAEFRDLMISKLGEVKDFSVTVARMVASFVPTHAAEQKPTLLGPRPGSAQPFVVVALPP